MKGKLVLPHNVLDPQAVSREPAGSKLVWLEPHFEGVSFSVGVKYLIQFGFFLSFFSETKRDCMKQYV